MQYRQTFGALSQPRYLSVAFGTDTTQKFLEKLIKKKINFLGYGKILVTQFSLLEKCLPKRFHTIFCLYGIVWNCMTKSVSCM